MLTGSLPSCCKSTVTTKKAYWEGYVNVFFYKARIQGLQQCFPRNLHLPPKFHKPVPPFKYVIETPLQHEGWIFTGKISFLIYL